MTAINTSNQQAIPGGKLPPQAVETEMCVLGCMVLDKEAIGEILQAKLTAEDFYRHDHRVIFETLIRLYEANKPVDLVILRDELKSRGLLEQVGGVEYLVQLTDSVPSAANALHYAETIRDKALLRELICASSEICTQAFDEHQPTGEILEQAEQRIFQVTEKKIVGQALQMHDLISNVYASLEHRTGGITGIPSGFLELDELTSGLQRGEMIIIAARPSMGKTALGLNIAEHVGADNHIPVAIFSLEMAAQQLAERLLASRSHIDSHCLRKGMLNERDYEALNTAAGELAAAPIFVDDTPSLTPLELRAKARRLKMQHNIDLVVIDYLQLMHSPGAESRQLEVGEISRHLKALGRELNIPVIVMAQLNRGPEGREGHRPRMSDLRESGNIEQDADVVILLHREDYYHNEPEYQRENNAELIIAKQRNGPTDTLKLSWLPQWTRFENLAHAPEPYGV